MELAEYLRLVANRLDSANKEEALRLVTLLRDALNDVIKKEKQ